MYFPIRWPQVLNIDRAASATLTWIASDYNRTLFAVLTENSIGIWFEKLCVQITSHVRTAESLSKHGSNSRLVWKRDSSMLAILTSKGHLLMYRVITEESRPPLFEQVDSNQANLKRESAELFVKDRVLPIKLMATSHLSTSADVASVLNFGAEELLLCCGSGLMLRVGWDAALHQELTLDLRDVPFHSGAPSAPRPSPHRGSLEVQDVQYLPLLGGLAIVFRNGRAAVVLSSSPEFESKDAHAVWIPDVTEATVTAVNHRYRLVAIGLANGQGAVFYLDEASGQFVASHRLCLSPKDFPEAGAGAVSQLQWTPDGCALVLAWARGGFSLWSVFGSLLACSLNWDGGPPACIHALEWGSEGYQLWMVSSPSDRSEQRDVMLMNFVKSASTVNPGPCGGVRQVLLQGADRVLVSSESDLADRDTPWPQDGCRGNKHWTVELVPHTYLAANWPIRYSAIDAGCHHVAVAGRGGFAHCSLAHNKWKFFGNETQEQDFVVTGGLLWWESLVVLGCINLRDGSDEVRLYPRSSKLDDVFVRVLRMDAQVLQLALSEDRLLVFASNSRLALHRISHNAGLERLQELDLSALVPHPLCVVSATLVQLGARGPSKLAVLLNVAGRLVLLQQDPAAAPPLASPRGAPPPLRQWSAPTVLAFCVERVWVAEGRPDSRMPHLTQALWIACGVHGMQVWLPLFPPGDTAGAKHAFMAKRIMLPIAVHIYPLAVLFQEAVVLGAESDTALCGSDPFPLCVVSKSSQVYLHLILRQLLCRNLGYHAWEIARSCAELPYFHHSLELLLHEVLEEEAMSSEPIPDALLPRVIDFIREFPVFLQTVVQCARKTELALWPHLFAAVGNPKDLFQECLLQGQLDTAASYLLVLQNLEVPLVSRQHATLLLGAALDGAHWALARDLVRFLRAINPEAESSSPPRPSAGPSTDEDTVNQVFMEVILTRHARKLLAAGQLRKLGSFAAHLDFPLQSFLEKERLRAAHVEDFVSALKSVHADFDWSMPTSPASTGGGGATPVGGAGDEETTPHASSTTGQPQRNGGIEASVTRGSPADSESTSEESWWPEDDEAGLHAASVAELRGSPQAEAQARYLLHILGQARCCDWALPLALMLGDTLVAPLVASPAALDKLMQWALAECPGYVGLLRQVQGRGSDMPSSNGVVQRSPMGTRRTAAATEGPEEGCRVS